MGPMADNFTIRNGVRLAYRIDGPTAPETPTLLLIGAMGTSLHLWDAILPLLPEGLRILRCDLRGHGRSAVPEPPYSMGGLIADVVAICDACQARDTLCVGLSLGGMIAQGLAVKRPHLIRALVLSNTAAKIGTPPHWERRITALRKLGHQAVIDEVLPRWVGRDYARTAQVETLRAMLRDTAIAGYAGAFAAVAGTDFYTPTATLRIPTLGLAGSEDGFTPPDLVKDTIDLIPGAQFTLIPRVGHFPCLEAPKRFAEAISAFITATGHMQRHVP